MLLGIMCQLSKDPLVAGLVLAVAGLVAGYAVGLQAGKRRGGGLGNGVTEASGKKGEGVELYVGNLAYDVKEKELEKAFGKHGEVVSTRIIRNRANGRSKGYGFVQVADENAAKSVIKGMHGKDFKNRKLVVNEAKSKGDEY